MPTILGANTLSSAYDVDNSLRFNGDNFLQRNNPSSNSTDGTKGTFSFWVKRDKFPNESQVLVHQADSSTKRFALQIANNDQFIFSIRNDAESVDIDGTTTLGRVYRDVTAWYHFLFNYDTSGGTNGCKLFVNGVEQALSYSATLPQNFVMTVNTNGFNNHTIGRDSTQSSNFWTGYMTEVMFVDGQQLAPTQFGEYDEDSPTTWKPKNISGINVGNLGYYLDFEDASNLGNDVKGVGDFSETNCATTDQATDTCTNNFATLNSLLDVNATPTITEGSLKFAGTGSTNFVGATIPVSSGKWYVEVKATTVSGSYPIIGVIDAQSSMRRDSTYFVGSDASTENPSGFAVFTNSDIYHNGDNNFGDLTTTYGNGDIIGMALDMDASPNTLGFYKNGTSEASINLDTAPSGAYMFAAGIHSSTSGAVGEFNFGNPSFSISSGNSDANGYGNFEYSVPSGYYALNTKNLAEYG
tara:strand:- start:26 stop:1432 length:1407 start_codon:yes stop_codon:yes gene_type:complete